MGALFPTLGARGFFFRSEAAIEILVSGAKSDIKLWLNFLEDFNRRSFFFGDVWETSQTLQVYKDSAGSIGFGAVLGVGRAIGKLITSRF